MMDKKQCKLSNFCFLMNESSVVPSPVDICNVKISLYRNFPANQIKDTVFQPNIHSIYLTALKKKVQFMLKIMHQFEFDKNSYS